MHCSAEVREQLACDHERCHLVFAQRGSTGSAQPADLAMRPLKRSISREYSRLWASHVMEGSDAVGQLQPKLGEIRCNLAGLVLAASEVAQKKTHEERAWAHLQIKEADRGAWLAEADAMHEREELFGPDAAEDADIPDPVSVDPAWEDEEEDDGNQDGADDPPVEWLEPPTTDEAQEALPMPEGSARISHFLALRLCYGRPMLTWIAGRVPRIKMGILHTAIRAMHRSGQKRNKGRSDPAALRLSQTPRFVSQIPIFPGKCVHLECQIPIFPGKLVHLGSQMPVFPRKLVHLGSQIPVFLGKFEHLGPKSQYFLGNLCALSARSQFFPGSLYTLSPKSKFSWERCTP